MILEALRSLQSEGAPPVSWRLIRWPVCLFGGTHPKTLGSRFCERASLLRFVEMVMVHQVRGTRGFTLPGLQLIHLAVKGSQEHLTGLVHAEGRDVQARLNQLNVFRIPTLLIP